MSPYAHCFVWIIKWISRLCAGVWKMCGLVECLV